MDKILYHRHEVFAVATDIEMKQKDAERKTVVAFKTTGKRPACFFPPAGKCEFCGLIIGELLTLNHLNSHNFQTKQEYAEWLKNRKEET